MTAELTKHHYRPAVDLGFLVFAAMLTASLVLNVRLGLARGGKAAIFEADGLATDTHVPVMVVSGSGMPARPLTFSRDTLLYVFSPNCESSKANYSNLLTIAAATHTKYDIVGLYLTPNDTDADVRIYSMSHPFPGTLLRFDANKAALSAELLRRIGTTPQLLVVASGGLIRRSWSGALFGRRQREVEQFFGFALPGAKLVGGLASEPSRQAVTR